jgi:DNA-binding transcriptional LysR family regulator
MRRDELGDLLAFLAVAEERSFTRAAAQLSVSQSMLSQIVRRIEERLGVKLLTRTTRNVTPTDAGEHLIATLRPALADIETRLTSISSLRDTPAGIVRITTSQHAAETVIWPKVSQLLTDYPDVDLELSIDAALTNIVTDRFDAGVRLGERVEKDMIAVRIGPDLRMAVVGSPDYFFANPAPVEPQELTAHSCINIRMPSSGSLYSWEFEKDGRELHVRVDGQLTFNHIPMALHAAADGFGLACVLEDQADEFLAKGKVVRVLEDWCPPFAGYHLYYPDRRQLPPAFRLIVEALRHRA